MTDDTHRAVLNHGLHGDLIASAVGLELGAQLQSAITSDVSDGATPGDILQALRGACDQDPVAYARLLELVVLAGVDELQVIAGNPSIFPFTQSWDRNCDPEKASGGVSVLLRRARQRWLGKLLARGRSVDGVARGR